jgi:hypothetical protein
MNHASFTKSIIEERQKLVPKDGFSAELNVVKEGAFAIRVEDRKIKTLDKLILERIKPKTTIISDDWPAYRNLGKRLGKPIGFKHFIICHKKQFARYAYFFNLFNFLERLLKMIFL